MSDEGRKLHCRTRKAKLYTSRLSFFEKLLWRKASKYGLAIRGENNVKVSIPLLEKDQITVIARRMEFDFERLPCLLFYFYIIDNMVDICESQVIPPLFRSYLRKIYQSPSTTTTNPLRAASILSPLKEEVN